MAATSHVDSGQRLRSPRVSRNQEITIDAVGPSDDSRSSSLSEYEEASESGAVQPPPKNATAFIDGDSEAETERLEISPNKSGLDRLVAATEQDVGKNLNGSLIKTKTAKDMEVDRLSDSAISSPDSSEEDMLSEGEGGPATDLLTGATGGIKSANISAGIKRKRASLEDGSDASEDEKIRARGKREGASRSNSNPDDLVSIEGDLSNADLSDEGSDAGSGIVDEEEENELGADDDEDGLISSQKVMIEVTEQAKEDGDDEIDDPDAAAPGDEQMENVDASDEEDLAEADDNEDAEAAARSEEERKYICF